MFRYDPVRFQLPRLRCLFEAARSRRAVKSGARFGVPVNDGVRHSKERGHHRFGARIPEVAVIFDDARINFHVPIRHIDFAYTLDLPKVQFVSRAVQGESVSGKVLFEICFERSIAPWRFDRLMKINRDVVDQRVIVARR
jgi:hypothetical protein